jgi:hypothetical protein
MLNILTNQKVRSRMQSGPIGPYLSEIATVLWQPGYARGTIRLRLGFEWQLVYRREFS